VAEFDLNAFAASLLLRPALTETTTARTAKITDNNLTVICSNAALVTVTIPKSLPVGWAAMYYATGAAGLTVVAASGVTFLGSSPNDTVARNQGIYVEVVGVNTAILVGGTS